MSRLIEADPERLLGLDGVTLCAAGWVAVLQGGPEPIHQNCVSVAISTRALSVRMKRSNALGFCAVSCTRSLLAAGRTKNSLFRFSFWIRALVLPILAEWLVNLFTDFKMLIYEHRYVWVRVGVLL